jgi:hypothetical protein
MVKPKVKNIYKTRKAKEKDTTMKKLVMVAHTMVSEEFHDEEAQNLKDLRRR